MPARSRSSRRRRTAAAGLRRRRISRGIRLKDRFLDLRRERLHDNIVLRSNVISSIRQRMIAQGFTEFQTPILTASSPEGARDFLVPRRVHPGQVLRAAAGAAEVQAAAHGRGLRPLFPDRALLPRRGPRADRSPGEFYQLDFEMSFVTRKTFSRDRAGAPRRVRGVRRRQESVTPAGPFPRIPYGRRCSNTAATSPTCATRSRSQDVIEPFRRARASACSPDRRGRHVGPRHSGAGQPRRAASSSTT